jgi:hypothetical protein
MLSAMGRNVDGTVSGDDARRISTTVAAEGEDAWYEEADYRR